MTGAGFGSQKEKNKKMVKVSVVIPVYNVERFLPACLNSVLGQSLKDIEILCIDDASPDRCPEILDDYAGKDPRIRVFHLPENHRQGYARNLGIRNAEGKYIYLLDSDDLIDPDALEALYQLAEQDDLDAVFFDGKTIFESEELQKKFSSALDLRTGVYPEGVVKGQDLFTAFVEQNEWVVFIQREFWNREYLLREEIFFPEEAEHEDQFFSIAGLLGAEKVRYIRRDYFTHRFREDSVMTSKPAPKNFHGYFVNLYRLIDYIRRHNIQCEAADRTIRNLFSVMLSLKTVFMEEENRAAWFKKQGLENEYIFFEYLMKEQERRTEEDKCLFAPLSEYSNINIYGAGVIAGKVFSRLNAADFIVDNFIVSRKEGNPDYFRGRKVFSIQEYNHSENDIVLVAMAKGNHEEVSKRLQERRIPHFLYANNILEGPICP